MRFELRTTWKFFLTCARSIIWAISPLSIGWDSTYLNQTFWMLDLVEQGWGKCVLMPLLRSRRWNSKRAFCRIFRPRLGLFFSRQKQSNIDSFFTPCLIRLRSINSDTLTILYLDHQNGNWHTMNFKDEEVRGRSWQGYAEGKKGWVPTKKWNQNKGVFQG